MRCTPRRKQAVSLIEVLLAIALVALCLVPLIGSHSFLFRSEYEQAAELDLDREVGRLQFQIVRGLYAQEYSLDRLLNATPRRVELSLLSALRYQGYWWFEVEKRKPRGDEAKVFLLHIVHSFGPPEATPELFVANPKGRERVTYRFPFTLVREGA